MSFNFTEEFKLNGATGGVFTFYKKGFKLGVSSPSFRNVILSGVSPLALEKAISLNYVKLFGGTELLPETYLDTVTLSGGTEQRNLPVGYTQVEYLTLDGDQYLLTDYYPNSNTELDIKYYPSVSSRFMCIYGVQDSTSANRFYGLVSSTQFKLQMNYSNQGASFWGFNNDGTFTRGSSNGTFTSYREIVSLVIKKDLVSVTANSVGTINYDMTNDDTWGVNVNCTYPMMIGSRSTAGLEGNNFIGNLYPITIKENNVVLRNYIPCRRNSDSVLGMYDTVTGTFFTNAGTGTFTAGQNINDLEIYTDGTTETVTVTGKNLFDKNNTLGDGKIWSNGKGGQGTLSGYYGVNPISVIGGHTYTRSGEHGGANYFLLDDDTSLTVVDSSDTITVPDNALLWYFNNAVSTDRNTMMIVEGNTLPTTYEPYYNGGTATAENLLKLGTYTDEQEVLAGNVSRNIGVLVLDGTEEWNQTSTGKLFYNSVSGIPSGVSDTDTLKCSHFKQGARNAPLEGEISFRLNFNGFILNWDATATVEQFKQWLANQYNAGTPVIIVYPLATATTETVTAQPLSVQTGSNIVTITQASIDNLEMEVSYKQSV